MTRKSWPLHSGLWPNFWHSLVFKLTKINVNSTSELCMTSNVIISFNMEQPVWKFNIELHGLFISLSDLFDYRLLPYKIIVAQITFQQLCLSWYNNFHGQLQVLFLSDIEALVSLMSYIQYYHYYTIPGFSSYLMANAPIEEPRLLFGCL